MGTQSLAEDKAMFLLSSLTERKSVYEIRDFLQKNDALGLDRDAAELAQTRHLIGRHRKRCLKAGEIQHELINLFELNDDGYKVEYYKPFGELNVDESAQLLDWCRSRCESEHKKFWRYYKPLKKKYGRKLQRLLNFDLPPQPTATEPAKS